MGILVGSTGWVLVLIGHTVVFKDGDVVPISCTESSLWTVVRWSSHQPNVLIFTITLSTRDTAASDGFTPVSNGHVVKEAVCQWNLSGRLTGLLSGVWSTHDHDFHVGNGFIQEKTDDIVIAVIVDVSDFHSIQSWRHGNWSGSCPLLNSLVAIAPKDGHVSKRWCG